MAGRSDDNMLPELGARKSVFAIEPGDRASSQNKANKEAAYIDLATDNSKPAGYALPALSERAIPIL